MQYRVTFKERFYFLLMVTIGIASYIGIGSQLLHLFRGLDHTTAPLIYIYSVYLALVMIYVFVFQPLWLKGFLIGHAIKITEKQFPLYSAVIKEQAALLNLKNVPNAYMIQTGGMLNAFATRILRKNYIVLHSAILEHALKEGQGELEFIIGHELGHLKRNHVSFFWH
jgi:Zn-dependent protease with chaperone function